MIRSENRTIFKHPASHIMNTMTGKAAFEMFPLGKDETPYKKLTSDYVSTDTFRGKEVLVVEAEGLRLLSEQAFSDINHLLRPGHLKQLASILDDPEATDNDRFVAYDLLKNANIAAGGVLPMCQDTGTAIIMGKKGRYVWSDGGDEALSGYTIYQGEKFAAKYNRLPSAAQSIFAQAAAGTASLFRGKPRYKLNRVRNVLRSAALPFEQRLTEKVSWADSSLIKSIFDGQPNRIKIEEYISDIMGRCPYKDPFYRLMHYNLKYSLPDKMLVKVDRMSMAHSLEVRTPFLDYRLIELMVKTHKDVKMRKMERKSVLRNTVAKRLPPALMNAPKKGFAVPIGEWFKGQGLSDQADNLLQPGGIGLNGKVMRDIVEQNNAGTENYGNLIWILTVLDRIVRK